MANQGDPTTTRTVDSAEQPTESVVVKPRLEERLSPAAFRRARLRSPVVSRILQRTLDDLVAGSEEDEGSSGTRRAEEQFVFMVPGATHVVYYEKADELLHPAKAEPLADWHSEDSDEAATIADRKHGLVTYNGVAAAPVFDASGGVIGVLAATAPDSHTIDAVGESVGRTAEFLTEFARRT